MITEDAFSFDEYDTVSAKQFLADFTTAYYAIPAEYRDRARVEIEPLTAFCEEYTFFLRYDRHRTEEERAAQQKEIDACTRRTEAKEREELARLKAKYGE